ncbi:MAG: 4-hydroxyphenylpyruvate dioxygenase [Bacteroidetes bacterium]|nr:MAG: 4-hydroxyphenylpyruvate dioxygenase [Bacteroidota bacterium]
MATSTFPKSSSGDSQNTSFENPVSSVDIKASSTETQDDFLPINGTDYVEFYVGNAKQAAHYYQSAFGFQLKAYQGLETGVRDRCTYVVQQGKIRFLLTSAMNPDSPVGNHVLKHGDGVKDIALWVDDAVYSFEETVRRGAIPVQEPNKAEDEHGCVITATIETYGETVHTFVQRDGYVGAFMPGYIDRTSDSWQPEATGLRYVDHCVGNVILGDMDRYVDFYSDVMGFVNILSFDDKDISTEYSALMSKVMANGNGRIKFPINEPASGLKKSQIEEYLDYYHGPGVQHIAMATDNIIETVTEIQKRGVEFLFIPSEYYQSLTERVGEIDEEIDALEKLGILVDRDEEGYLLQIFTKPVQNRPTMFYEIIQRKGAKSFGKGNFKALFESIEHEQERRGNL